MAANPLLPTEIESWARQAHVSFTPWQFDLIGRLDEALLATSRDKSTPSKGKPGDPIPMSNAAGIRALFEGLAVTMEARGKGSPTSPNHNPRRRH